METIHVHGEEEGKHGKIKNNIAHETNDYLWAVHKIDVPSKSWIDSIASPKVRTTKRQGVGAHSMSPSTSKVEGRIGALGWGLGRVTSGSIIPKDLHKPNNKLVNT